VGQAQNTFLDIFHVGCIGIVAGNLIVLLLVVGKLSWNADAAFEVHLTSQKCTVSKEL